MTDNPSPPHRRGRRPVRSRRTPLVAGASVLLVGTLASGLPAASAEAPAGTLRAEKAEALPGMWWYDAMNIDEAHKEATGKGVTIAVIDGPVDPSVPELRGQDVTPVRNYCADPGEDPVKTASATGMKARHATGITALLVGNGQGSRPGGAGVKGIAPDASVRNYVVDEDPTGKDHMRCSDEDVDVHDSEAPPAAVRDAVRDGADVINMSFHGAKSEAFSAAIRFAQRHDVVVTASSGNDGSAVAFPALLPGVVSVGMLDKSASASPKSGHGGSLVATAPGVDVSAGSYVSGEWDSRLTSTGTSLSTPLAAGAVALTKEKYPSATNWQLVRHLVYRAGGDDEFDWSERVGFGAVSVTRMLADDPTQWRDTNPFQDVSPQYFIEQGDNELTGTRDQLADYRAAPAPTTSETDGAQAGTARSESSSSTDSLPVPALLVAAGAILGSATGAAWWLRRRRA